MCTGPPTCFGLLPRLARDPHLLGRIEKGGLERCPTIIATTCVKSRKKINGPIRFIGFASSDGDSAMDLCLRSLRRTPALCPSEPASHCGCGWDRTRASIPISCPFRNDRFFKARLAPRSRQGDACFQSRHLQNSALRSRFHSKTRIMDLLTRRHRGAEKIGKRNSKHETNLLRFLAFFRGSSA